MALLVVHAIRVSPITLRAMALNAVGNLLRRRPFRGRPAPLKVFVEGVYHGVDDLPRHLGASLIFLWR